MNTELQTQEPAEEPTKSHRGRRVLAAALGAVVLLSATGALAWAGSAGVFTAAKPTNVEVNSIQVSAGETQYVCPAAMTSAVGDLTGLGTQFDSVSKAESTLVSVSAPGSVYSRTVPAAAITLTPTGKTQSGTPEVSKTPSEGSAVVVRSKPQQSYVVTAQPVQGKSSIVTSVVGSISQGGDLRGLSAAGCSVATAEQWLIGGSTDLGSSARLTLTNPGQTTTSVTVELWGPSGKLPVTGATSLTVTPGTSRSLLLEGTTEQVQRIATHVVATGGVITAVIDDIRLNGYTPAGADVVSASSVPLSQGIITGIDLGKSSAQDADPSVVRLLVPGETGARVTLRLFGPKGEVTVPGGSSITVPAQKVTDFSLAGIEPGAYSVLIDSDQPITGSAMIVRGGNGSNDPLERAWSPMTSTLTASSSAIFPGVKANLVMTAGAQATTVQIRQIDSKGAVSEPKAISIPANTTVSQEISGAVAVYTDVTGEYPIASAMVFQSTLKDKGTGIAVVAGTPDPSELDAVSVLK